VVRDQQRSAPGKTQLLIRRHQQRFPDKHVAGLDHEVARSNGRESVIEQGPIVAITAALYLHDGFEIALGAESSDEITQRAERPQLTSAASEFSVEFFLLCGAILFHRREQTGQPAPHR